MVTLPSHLLFDLLNNLCSAGPIGAYHYPLKEVDSFHEPFSRVQPKALELVVYLSGQRGNTSEVYLLLISSPSSSFEPSFQSGPLESRRFACQNSDVRACQK